MLSRLKENLCNIIRRYWLTALTALITAAIGIMLTWAGFERHKAISRVQNEFDDFANSLAAVGYDLAYDRLTFSSFSPWQIMRVENLRIYSLDGSNYWEWKCPELALSTDLWDANKIRLHFSSRQSIQRGLKIWEVNVPQIGSEVQISKDGKLQSFSIQAQDLSVNNLFTAEQFNLAGQRMAPHQIKEHSPFIDLVADVRNVDIDDITGWPLNKHIDHLYLNSEVIGVLEKQPIYSESLYNWIENGGNIEIRRMIINWKPLVLVGKGDLYFDEALNPKLSVNTSSIALIETLDRLNQNGMLDDKGVFVAKILLSNKAFKKKGTDQYFTVTTPVRMDKEQVLIENIPVKNFIPKTEPSAQIKK